MLAHLLLWIVHILVFHDIKHIFFQFIKVLGLLVLVRWVLSVVKISVAIS